MRQGRGRQACKKVARKSPALNRTASNTRKPPPEAVAGYTTQPGNPHLPAMVPPRLERVRWHMGAVSMVKG